MRKYFNICRFKKRKVFLPNNSMFVYNTVNKVFLLNQNFLPRRFIKIFKKKAKKLFKKKKIPYTLFMNYNFIISYKGKNPRMGKGIGFFVRKTIITKKNKPIFRIKRYNLARSLSFSFFLKKKTHINTFIFRKNWYF